MRKPEPIRNPPPSRWRKLLPNAALALGSAIMVWLAFPPADAGLFAWVALVPWLVLIARASRRAGIAWSAAAGAALFTALLHWVRFVSIAGWLALALYCAAYWPVAAWSLGVLRRRGFPFMLSAPLVITLLEFIRGRLFTGFSFYFLGHSQHGMLPVIQVADITGVCGITFLIALVNGCVADGILRRHRPKQRILVHGIAVGALVALALGYGFLRMGSSETRLGPRVHIVQANIPLNLKHTLSLEESLSVLKKHVDLSRQPPGGKADMVIWSETMFPAPINHVCDPGLAPSLLKDSREKYRDYGKFLLGCGAELRRALATARTHMLIGVETHGARRFNSAYLISPQGGILGRYDKMHLVVFGEYVPLARVFPFLRMFRPAVMGKDLTPGKVRQRFNLPAQDGATYEFGVTICYEDAEPGLFRKFVRDGADFMVNITNDGWFRDSSELDHHLAVCVFRAVENRVPIARCANTGISALIAPDGRVAEKVALADGTYREVEGTLTGHVEMTTLRSFYAAHGDLFAWLCAVALFVMCAASFLRRSADRTAGP